MGGRRVRLGAAAPCLGGDRLEAAAPQLRNGLIEPQFKLKDAGSFALLIVLTGPDGGGKRYGQVKVLETVIAALEATLASG